MNDYIQNLTKKLCAAYSGTTDERACLDVLCKVLKTFCKEVYFDNMGNLVALRRSKIEGAKKLVFTAYVDSPCFIACYIAENGRVKVEKLGGIDVNSALYGEVVFSGGTHGILLPGSAKGATAEDVYIDLGVSSREEAEKLISLGETAIPIQNIQSFGEKLFCFGIGAKLCASALADAFATVYAVAFAAAEPSDYDIYAVFTVQGRLNRRGLEATLAGISPDVAIAVEALPEVNCLSVIAKEKSGVYSPEITERLAGAAKKAEVDIKLSVSDEPGDCGLMLRSGALCGKLCIPLEFAGTRAESARLFDAKKLSAVLLMFTLE